MKYKQIPGLVKIRVVLARNKEIILGSLGLSVVIELRKESKRHNQICLSA